MTLAINVQDGTSAGKRRLLEAAKWSHHCVSAPKHNDVTSYSRLLSSYSCPDCGARRP